MRLTVGTYSHRRTPAGQSVDAVRPIREDIEERVRRLLDELGITPD